MPTVKASELKGKNRCFFRRSREIQTESSKNDVFERAVFEKSVIKNWFYSKSLRNQEGRIKMALGFINAGVSRDDAPDEYAHVACSSILRMCGINYHEEEFDEQKALMLVKLASRPRFIRKLVEEKFRSMPFATTETAILKAESTSNRILRYLDWEKRTPIIPGESITLDLFGEIDVITKPDLIFLDEKNKTAEAVKICCRKPDVTLRGRTRDKSVKQSLELYAMWKYVQEFTDVEPENAFSSYYFMRTSRDRRDHFAPEFAEEGKQNDNIVTLKQGLVKDSLDKLFEPQVDEFVIGEKCCGETCEGCDFNALCNFTNAPLKSEEPKARKRVSDISLSKAQEEAVYARKNVIRVNAGAGAGKTLVVALRTAFMLDEGVEPEEILLITFTDAGAAEMRERIEMYDEDLGTDTDMSRLPCMTFNAFGNEIIKQEYKKLGFAEQPSVIGDIERKQIISELLDKFTISGLEYENFDMDMPGGRVKGARACCEKAFEIIKKERLSSYSKDELKDLMVKENLDISIDNDLAYQELLDLYEEYDAILRDRCLIEFADQEKLVFDLLDMDPYYLDSLGIKHIIIDEFQDSSVNQIELAKKLLESSSFESLMVVGDDSQSIYSFRGACSDNIIDFFDIIGVDGEDIYITENYRSDPAILDFANKLNARNSKRVEKDLIPTRTPNGKTPVVKGFHSVKEEYEYIAEVIKEKQEEGIKLDDIAVLAATRSELLKISSVLSDQGIETILQAPEPTLENSRVQGIIAFAHAYEDENATKDILIFMNCIRGGDILELDDDELSDEIEKGVEMIRNIKHQFGPKQIAAFEAVIEDIAGEDDIALKLHKALKRFPKIVNDNKEDDKKRMSKIGYLKSYERFGGEAVKRDGKYSGVVLSTAHSSKGLEWPVVINSITKYDRKNLAYDMVDERRRLMFVSVTRARDELYITGQIKIAGNEKDGYAYNRFLSEAAEIAGVALDREDAKGKLKDKADKEAAKKRIAKKKAEKAESASA